MGQELASTICTLLFLKFVSPLHCFFETILRNSPHNLSITIWHLLPFFKNELLYIFVTTAHPTDAAAFS